MQRHGVGQAADVARDHRYGPELAHGAGVAEQDAVEQAPAHIGQGHAPEHLPAGGAQGKGGLFLGDALFLHQRNQFAGDEGKGHEHGCQHEACYREDHLDAHRIQPRTQVTLRAEEQHVDEAGDHGRDRERQVDQGDEQALAAKLELGNRPGGGEAEDRVQGHGDGGHGQRQPDGGLRIFFRHGVNKAPNAISQGFRENRNQGRQEKQRHEAHRDKRQGQADGWRLLRGQGKIPLPVHLPAHLDRAHA